MGYPSDLTDAQWALVEPLLPPAKPGGRPRTTSVRRVFDAVRYLNKTGCQWRQLPADFPHWRTVYGYFKSWQNGAIRNLHRYLYFRVRKHEGRAKYPSTIIIDSQSVKTGKMGGEVRGYDGGKRIKGRKRHLAVDSLGLPLAISVTAANVHDLNGGRLVLNNLGKFLRGRTYKKVYADGAYGGEAFRSWVRGKFNAALKISKNLALKLKQFVPISQRWVVERSFAWLGDYRRLTIDFERLVTSSRSLIRLAAINLMLNRLAPNPQLAW